MPAAREYRCYVKSTRWVTPTVIEILAVAQKPIHFEAGQFLSLLVPNAGKTVKRLYSFASAPGGNEFVLCIKYVRGGVGSEYVASLQATQEIRVMSPYGDFVYETEPGRAACFIATGTGIAPMRSIVASEKFKSAPPKVATLIFGARDSSEILYPGEFEKRGVKTVIALSQERAPGRHFNGRVTDYLRSLPNHWNWHGTDFYLCGNGDMIQEVMELLTAAHGVSSRAIRAEAFGASAQNQSATTIRSAA